MKTGISVSRLLILLSRVLKICVVCNNRAIILIAWLIMKVDLAPIFELGLSEKLQLLEDLWDDIATKSANLPVLDWQKEELAQRKALHLQDPSLASSWESVKARIRSNISF
jgi:putative addiction module component (TIGR02574 family)